jgi:hypothetical protein
VDVTVVPGGSQEVHVVVEEGLPGPPGPPGPSGSSAFYRHIQAVASTEWAVPHALGFIPNVTVMVNMGQPALSMAVGEIQHQDIYNLTITFAFPITGEAYIS